MFCLIASVVALIAISCNKQESTPPPQTASAEEQGPVAEPQATPAAEVAEAPKEEPALDTQPILVKGVGFMTPESILYDDKNDQYLVSNINGVPDGKDNNGFISKISPDGAVVALKWIEGGQNGVELNAPKGMVFRDDTLFVADINCVRMFDRATGAANGKIDIKGASFLNDLSMSPSGTLYVSDSGMKSGKEGLVATGKDAIYTIDSKNKSKKLISGKNLHQPNGLLAEDGGVWVVTMGGKEMYRISEAGKKESITEMPGGSLDGVVKISGGDMLVSSWESSAVYRGNGNGEFVAAWADLKSPADIGYDMSRNRLLVPLFTEDAVQIQPISENAAVTAQNEPAASKEAVATTAPKAGEVATSTGKASSPSQTAASSTTTASAKKEGAKATAPEPETAASKEDKTAGSSKKPASSTGNTPASSTTPASATPPPASGTGK